MRLVGVTVTMSHFVPVLDAVRVSAVREIGLNRVGFSDRKKSGNGTFYGPDVMRRRNPDKLNMLLETAPSLRMGTDADGHRYVTGRNNGCVQYWVDGHPWYTGNSNAPEMSPDNFLSGAELAGVEIYDELSAPAEFASISGSCAVIVVWTKQKLGVLGSHKPHATSVRRLACGFVGLTIVVALARQLDSVAIRAR